MLLTSAFLLVVRCGALAAGPAPAVVPAFEQLAAQSRQAREAGRFDDAIRLYRQAVQARPSWAEGWWYLGTLLYEKDRYAEAAGALRRYATLDAKSGPAWGMLGLCEFQTKRYGEALQHLQQGRSLGLPPGHSMADVVQYHILLLLNRFARFEAAFEAVQYFVQNGIETPPILDAAGMAALGVPLFPAELPERQREMVTLLGRAVYEASVPRASEANVAFKEVLDRYPSTPELHYLYGCFLSLNDSEAAFEQFRLELKISPRHVAARAQLARLYRQRGQFPEAQLFAEQAVSLSAGNAPALRVLGRVLIQTGEIEQGIRQLEAAAKLDPDNEETQYALVGVYRAVGRDRDAAKAKAELFRLKQLHLRRE